MQEERRSRAGRALVRALASRKTTDFLFCILKLKTGKPGKKNGKKSLLFLRDINGVFFFLVFFVVGLSSFVLQKMVKVRTAGYHYISPVIFVSGIILFGNTIVLVAFCCCVPSLWEAECG